MAHIFHPGLGHRAEVPDSAVPTYRRGGWVLWHEWVADHPAEAGLPAADPAAGPDAGQGQDPGGSPEPDAGKPASTQDTGTVPSVTGKAAKEGS